MGKFDAAIKNLRLTVEQIKRVFSNGNSVSESHEAAIALLEAAGKMLGPESYFGSKETMGEWVTEKITDIRARFIRPTHGNCCTCQRCGQSHDDCLCVEEARLVQIRALLDALPEDK